MRSNGQCGMWGGGKPSISPWQHSMSSMKEKNLEQVVTAQRSHLANWLTPCPTATVAPVYALRMPQPLHPHSPVRCTPEKDNPAISLDDLSHLEKVCTLAKWLPMSVPEAKEGDIIYVLRVIDPKSYVQTNCTNSPDEDWEVIDQPLNGIIGYSTMPSEIAERV